jgi:transposase
VSRASGVSRGDRSRNARLSRLRELVPVSNAIVGIDLADKIQTVVVRWRARRHYRARRIFPRMASTPWSSLRRQAR